MLYHFVVVAVTCKGVSTPEALVFCSLYRSPLPLFWDTHGVDRSRYSVLMFEKSGAVISVIGDF